MICVVPEYIFPGLEAIGVMATHALAQFVKVGGGADIMRIGWLYQIVFLPENTFLFQDGRVCIQLVDE